MGPPAQSLVGPDFAIPDTLGRTEGANLFHSFEQFNILLNQSATFTGPAAIDNVISRVTGPDASNINGLLSSTIPTADFYFINPNGVMFGDAARLDVQGSFYASTADTLRLADGSEFSASEANTSGFTAAALWRSACCSMILRP